MKKIPTSDGGFEDQRPLRSPVDEIGPVQS